MSGPEMGGGLDPALDAALARLDALVESFENDPDPAVRERAIALLQAVDVIHRPGLTRLAALLDAAGARERARSDPAVRVLLELYDLLPAAELRPAESGFVPLTDLKIKLAPRRYRLPAMKLSDLAPGAVLPLTLGETRVLLAAVSGRVVAYRNGCGTSPMPLDRGRLDGDVLICPWHGCRYDLTSGEQLDRVGEGLAPLPVEVVEGQVLVELAGRSAVLTGARA